MSEKGPILEKYREIIKSSQNYQEKMILALEFLRDNFRSNIKESELLIGELLKEAEREDDLESQGELYFFQAWLEFDYDNFPLGEEYLEKSWRIFKSFENKAGIMRVFTSLGFIRSFKGNPQEGFQYYQKALQLAREIEAVDSMGPIYGNMASDLSDLKRYEDALSYYKKALTYKLSGENKLVVLEGLGYTYHLLGDDKEALEHLKKAYELAGKNEAAILQISILSKMAMVYHSLGAYEQAIDAYKIAIDVSHSYKWVRIEISSSLHLGILYKELANLDFALEYLQRAYYLTLEVNIRPLEIESLKYIWQVLALAQRWSEALACLKEYHEKYLEYHGRETFKEIDRLKTNEAKKEKEFFSRMHSQLALIGDLGRKLTATLDNKEITIIMHKQLQIFMDVAVFGLGFYDETKEEISYQYFLGEDKGSEIFLLALEEDAFFSFCLKKRKEILINNYKKESKDFLDGSSRIISINEGTQSLICLPLEFGSRIIGLMTIQSPLLGAYDSYQLEIFKALAAYGAIAFENARLYGEVKNLASRDPLTKIFNRRYFLDLAKREFEHFKRYGGDFCLVMVDLDHFKRINDQYGHDSGDLVLSKVANFLASSIRKTDLLCRYGGEEFLLFFAGTSLREARWRGEELREALSELDFKIAREKTINITASFGLANALAEDLSLEDIIKRADLALYKAKGQGRNRLVFSN